MRDQRFKQLLHSLVVVNQTLSLLLGIGLLRLKLILLVLSYEAGWLADQVEETLEQCYQALRVELQNADQKLEEGLSVAHDL